METILLVQNDAQSAQDDAAVLESLGYEVILAARGEEALKLARSSPQIALALLDAGDDGSLRAAREILAHREIPIVFYSAHIDAHTVERLRAVPRDGVVSRDAGKFALQAAVELALESFQGRQALHDSQKRYQQFVENSRDMIWIAGPQGEITYLNSAALGQRQEPGAPETSAPFHEQLLEYIQSLHDGQPAAPLVIETRQVRADGTVAWSESVAGVLAENDAAPILLGVTRDISHHKRVEQELRESEERLHQIASALREVIWLRDAKTRQLLYVNPAFEELTGLSRDEFYRDPDIFINSIPAEDKGKIVKGNVFRSDIHRITRKDGVIRWVWGRTFPVRNEAGDIYRVAAIVEDITERKQTEEELKRAYERLEAQMDEIQLLQSSLHDQAIRDPLTGLFNRRYLNEALERELARAGRETYPVSLVMIDIDHFKQVNDSYGHPAGDLVLKNLASQLSGQTRASDLVCRFGGDEFLLVMPNVSIEIALKRAEIIRETFRASTAILEQVEIRATISLGVASFPAQGATPQEVLTAADQALYIAKGGGRDRVDRQP